MLRYSTRKKYASCINNIFLTSNDSFWVLCRSYHSFFQSIFFILMLRHWTECKVHGDACEAFEYCWYLICVFVLIYMCLCICICVYVFVYICICAFVFEHLYMHLYLCICKSTLRRLWSPKILLIVDTASSAGLPRQQESSFSQIFLELLFVD